MVRLKVNSTSDITAFLRFQFLYGAIKSPNLSHVKVSYRLFQFLYGAIKRVSTGKGDADNRDFNSFMVRLKVLDTTSGKYFFYISIPLWCD